MLKVVYISHYGTWGGAQRSLTDMIRNLPMDEVQVTVITPKGKFNEVLTKAGLRNLNVLGISKFDHTRIGYYRGWRWLILLRELWFLPFTLKVFLLNRKLFKEADIVHLNEITCLVPLLLSKWLYKKKTVLHARAVMNDNPKLYRTRMIGKFFRKYADVMIAIDENVKSSVPVHSEIHVVHNGLSLLHQKDFEDGVLRKKLESIPKATLNLGFVGAMDRNKGIFELVEAMNICRKKGMDIKLFALGGKLESARGLGEQMKTKFAANKNEQRDPIEEMITEYGLQNHVHLLGFSLDISAFYSFIEVICFPSYYDAPGRPVFEGALFGKPSILAVSRPFPDTFVEEVTGKQVQAGNVESIVEAIEFYYNNPASKSEMGEKALDLARKNFDIKRNAGRVLQIYKKLNQG